MAGFSAAREEQKLGSRAAKGPRAFKVIIWLTGYVFLPLRSIGFASDVWMGHRFSFYSVIFIYVTYEHNHSHPKYETQPLGNCKSLLHLYLVFEDVQFKKRIVFHLSSMIKVKDQ